MQDEDSEGLFQRYLEIQKESRNYKLYLQNLEDANLEERSNAEKYKKKAKARKEELNQLKYQITHLDKCAKGKENEMQIIQKFKQKIEKESIDLKENIKKLENEKFVLEKSIKHKDKAFSILAKDKERIQLKLQQVEKEKEKISEKEKVIYNKG